MTGQVQQMVQAIKDIQNWLEQLPVPGEAIVRQAIVLRLLAAAGFNIWNPLEVVPEETNDTGKRADFLIRTGKGKFALEIKGMNVTLKAIHCQQAATYAVNEGTHWAIITNGRMWVVIDEHMTGRWQERIALKLELGQEHFSEDFLLLFKLKSWQEDTFETSLSQIIARQRWRHDAEKTRREKTPIVEEIQKKYKIPSFELAISNSRV